jgi:hypothetical protein
VAFVRVQYGTVVESWYVFDTVAALTADGGREPGHDVDGDRALSPPVA